MLHFIFVAVYALWVSITILQTREAEASSSTEAMH